jgi:hypothetical protein
VLRRLFTVASCVSFLLFAASAMLWVRSYWMSYVLSVNWLDSESKPAGDHTIRIWNGGALMEVGRLGGPTWQFQTDDATPQAQPRRITCTSVPVFPYDSYARGIPSRFGFGRGSYAYVAGIGPGMNRLGTRSVFIVPLGVGTSLTAGLPVVWGWCWMIRRRRIRGGCGACGYDLTGNVSGVCPECGTAVEKVMA